MGRVRLSFGLAIFFVASLARAAEPPPLVAPKAISLETAPYPADAKGDVACVVELTVGVDGHVHSAHILDCAEPFARAALDASSAWTFEPARRGDVTLAAKIRVRVEFHEAKPEPPPDQTPTTPAPTASTTPSAAPPPEIIEEVDVRGQRAEAGRTTIGTSEVRQMPGAFGDPFRAIENLPGVTPVLSGLPYFYVRGAPPGDTGYFLDGVRVPLLYHVGLGPSVVHPALIDHVDFYPGGFPARFGRFAGGILSGDTRPAADHFHGEAEIRVFDTGALAEAPFADGRGSALVAGRYSYTAAIVSLAAPKTRLDYWDYQARVAYRITPKDNLTLFAFGSDDFLGQIQDDGTEETVFSSQFHRIDLRWDRDLDHGAHARTGITLGLDQSATDTVSGLRDRSVAARTQLDDPINSSLAFRTGADAALDHYDLATADNGRRGASRIYPRRNDIAMGVWADFVWRPAPRVEIVPGVRADYFGTVTVDPVPGAETNAAVPAIDPRLGARITLSKTVTLVSALGVTHQTPAFFVPIPGLQIAGLSSGLQTALQSSGGAEWKLPYDFSLTTTGFLHDYLGLTDFATTCDAGESAIGNSCVTRRVRGRSFGLELLLRRSLTKRVSGWLSYTLSRTTRQSQAEGNYQVVLGEFDRTHVLSAIGSVDLGRGWHVGAKFLYYTGTPYSNQFQGVVVPPYNTQRLPAFWRIDGRVEKRWQTGKRSSISFIVEWLNMTINSEAEGVSCNPTGGPTLDQCTTQYIGPITIPSIGVEGVLE